MADDVQVENRRLDASGNEALIGMARMGADAFGYTADLRIDRQLAQLLRLRVSQLNNCSYCLNLHYQAAREAGIPRAKIDTLTAWWETELHSEAEQAALRYTEALTRAADTDRDAAFQRFHDALAEHFSPEEILEIVGLVVNMNSGPGSSLPRARCRARPELRRWPEAPPFSPSCKQPSGCRPPESPAVNAYHGGGLPERSNRPAAASVVQASGFRGDVTCSA